MSGTLPETHALFLDRVRAAVAADDRLNALLIGGSYVHGGLDHHSDLDFVIVARDESYTDMMATRMDFAQRLPGFINAFTGEHVGEPRLLICLYGPPLLHIDLKFVLASDLDRQIERRAVLYARDPQEIEGRIAAGAVTWPNLPPDWFEARAWIWLHYGATKLARGELYEAIGMLAFFRDQVLGPLMCRRAGLNQRGVRRLEALGLDPEGSLATTLAGHDAAAIRSAILAAIDLYLDLRGDEPPARPTIGMPMLLWEFMAPAAQAVPAK
jgi:hypothetical protein